MTGRRIGLLQSPSPVVRGSDRGIFHFNDDNVALGLFFSLGFFNSTMISTLFSVYVNVFYQAPYHSTSMYTFTTIGLGVFPNHR